VQRREGHEETLTADAYVIALGSYSPLLTRPIGIDLRVYPLKGYSATMDVLDPAKAPTVSLTDEAAKIVMSRLGNRMRVAGTAELSGYSTEINPVRCEALVRRMREFFPGAADYDRPVFWAGLRPATPGTCRSSAARAIRTSTSIRDTARSAGPWPAGREGRSPI
jgi:D-amino-acid dehydrogenase